MLIERTIVSRHYVGLIVMLPCLFACQFCFAQPQAKNEFTIVQQDGRNNGKYGFIDRTGKVVVPFQFDHAWDFSEGLAQVELKGRKYFIDTTGRTVFEAKFDEVENFSEGLCAVNRGQKIDQNNGVVTNPGRWGYIDKTGKLVIPLKYTHAENFSEGLAAISNGDKGAFIDHDAKIVFEVPLRVTLDFHEGIVGIFYLTNLAYFDRTGKQISPTLKYGTKNHSFSEGLVPVEINGKTGFMDRSGKLVIAPQFEEAGDFSEGLAPVKVRGEFMTRCPREPSGYRDSFRMIWGYIDKTGKMVIPAQYAWAEPFSEGLAAINHCGEGFFIDKTGKKIALGNYSHVSPFVAGLSRVYVGTNEERMWGYINRTGKIVWGPFKYL